LCRRLSASVLSAAASQAADRAHRHVIVTQHLAAQPDAGEVPHFEHIALGDGHTLRFTFDKLHAAGGATGMPTASMQLIDPGILFQGKHESLALWNVKRTDPLDS
jgi:hypothetical protein